MHWSPPFHNLSMTHRLTADPKEPSPEMVVGVFIVHNCAHSIELTDFSTCPKDPHQSPTIHPFRLPPCRPSTTGLSCLSANFYWSNIKRIFINTCRPPQWPPPLELDHFSWPLLRRTTRILPLTNNTFVLGKRRWQTIKVIQSRAQPSGEAQHLTEAKFEMKWAHPLRLLKEETMKRCCPGVRRRQFS